jgi:hypothetical protein
MAFGVSAAILAVAFVTTLLFVRGEGPRRVRDAKGAFALAEIPG